MAWQTRLFPSVGLSWFRLLSLLAGCGAMIGSSFIFSCGAYANTIKATFSLTQSQVSLLSSILNFALCLGFCQGILQDKVGVFWNSFVTVVLATVSSLLIWSSTFSIEFYHFNFYLLAIFYFMFGLASGLAYMASVSINMSNYPMEYKGGISGVVFSAFYVGCFLSNHIFSSSYENDDNPADSNLSGFFLFQSIVVISMFVLATLLQNLYPATEDTVDLLDEVPDQADQSIGNSSRGDSISRLSGHDIKEAAISADDVTGLPLLKSLDFHLVAWSFVLYSGYTLVVKSTLLIYARSFSSMDYHKLTVLNSIIYILGGVACLIFGFLSDVLLKWTTRSSILLVIYIQTSLLILFAVFFMYSQAFLMILAITSMVGEGAAWGLTPPILSDLFGQKYFNGNWGLTMFVAGIYGFLSLYVSSSVYDAELAKEGISKSPLCHGLHCYQISNLFFSFAVLACTVMTVLLVYRDKKKRSILSERNDNGHLTHFEDGVLSYEQLG